MRAKKSYGQHFLNNPAICKNIVDLVPAQIHENVLEVGPGRGALTKELLQKFEHLRCVEADQDMVQFLHQHFPALSDKMIAADFLKVPLDNLFPDDFHLVGNFPYNISSQIVFHMLKYRSHVLSMTGMFQKEVADRIIAPHGSKAYGIISVLAQLHYDGSFGFNIKPGNFNPPPKVNSAVIVLKRKAEYEIDLDYALFRSLVKMAFNQRRKMLRNSIKSLLPAELSDDILPYVTMRPEQLAVTDFIALVKHIEKTKT